MIKKYLYIVVLALALVIVLFRIGKVNPGISSLRLCSQPSSNGVCTPEKTEFDISGGDIWATVYVAVNSPDKMSVKWVYVLDGVESELAKGEQEVSASGYQQFKLAKSELGWQEGSYRVEVKFGENTLSKAFKID